MLCLQSCQTIFNCIAEQVSKILKLLRLPPEMLEQQLFEATAAFILLNVSFKLRD